MIRLIFQTPSPDNPKIPVTDIPREEVKYAINDFKKGISPGPDYAMTTEVLQTGSAFIVDELNIICKLVFKEKHAPTQWTSRHPTLHNIHRFHESV